MVFNGKMLKMTRPSSVFDVEETKSSNKSRDLDPVPTGF